MKAAHTEIGKEVKITVEGKGESMPTLVLPGLEEERLYAPKGSVIRLYGKCLPADREPVKPRT